MVAMAMACNMHMAVLLLSEALIIISIILLASMWQPMVVAGSAPAAGGYRFELIHVDANRNFTRQEIIHRAVSRTRLRAAMLAAEEEDGGKKDAFSGSLVIPVEYSPYVYMMKLEMGTLPEAAPFLAVADTGSEVVWTKEMKRCTGCSRSFSTSNTNCAEDCRREGKVCHTCTVELTYGGGKFRMKGFTGMETLALPPATGTGTNKKQAPGGTREVELVCATEWTDAALPTPAQGMVGLSRGPMSLVTQLQLTKFSYCLSDPLKPEERSQLWLGDAQPTGGVGWRSTPLVEVPDDRRYFVELQEICVDKQCEGLDSADFKWKIPGKGLMMVDSGTTYTHLDHKLFEVLKELLFKVVKVHVDPKVVKEQAKHPDLPPKEFHLNCFKDTPDNNPDLVLRFKEADMRLPWSNYVSKEGCLNIEDADMSILGSLQQQNTYMIYDLAQKSLSFKKVIRDCSE